MSSRQRRALCLAVILSAAKNLLFAPALRLLPLPRFPLSSRQRAHLSPTRDLSRLLPRLCLRFRCHPERREGSASNALAVAPRVASVPVVIPTEGAPQPDEGSLPPFAPPLEFFQRVWGELLREKTPNPNKNPIANAATNQTPVATGWLLISGPNSNPRCACGGSDAFTDSGTRRAASQTNAKKYTGDDTATAAIPQQTP